MANDRNKAKSDGASKEDLSSPFSLLKANTAALNSLTDVVKGISKKMKSNSGSSSAKGDGGIRDYQNLVDDLDKDLNDVEKTAVSNRQKAISQFASAFRTAGNYVIRIFEDAHSKVASTYNSSFSKVTARIDTWNLGMSRYTDRLFNDTTKLYNDLFNQSSAAFMGKSTELFDKVVSDFGNLKLNVQFDSTDFIDQLQVNMEQGLRNQMAIDKSYSDLIVKKLVPSINTNTKEYKNIYKKMGNEYSKNLIGMSKLTEAVLGSAEWFEEDNGASITGQMFTQQLLAEAKLGGVSEDEVLDLENKLTAMFSSFSAAGVDANAIASMLKSSMDAGFGSDTMLNYSMGITSASDLINAINQGTFLDMFLNQVDKYYGGSNRTLAATYNNVLSSGLSLDDARLTSAYRDQISQNYSNIMNEISKVGVSEYAEQVTKNLEDQYQNASDKMDKYNNNVMTGIAVMTEQFPHFSEGIDVIISILSSISSGVYSLILSRNFGGGGSGGNPTSLIGGGGKSSPISSFLGKSVGSKGGTIGGVIGGVGSMVAGLALMASYGIGSANIAKDNGYGAGTQIGAGVAGALTGGATTIGMTEQQKLDKVKQDGSWFDLGAAGKAAGAGALLGAGIGTAAGGWAAGMGTVAGGLIGAASGFVTSLVDQAIEKADYDRFIKAQERATKSMESLSVAQSEYEATLEKSKSIEDLLEIMDSATASEKDKKIALDALIAEYPIQLGAIQNVTEWTDKQTEAIKGQIGNEEELSFYEVLNNLQDAANNVFVEDTNTNHQAYLQYRLRESDPGLIAALQGNDSEAIKNALIAGAAREGMTQSEYYAYVDRSGLLSYWGTGARFDENGNFDETYDNYFAGSKAADNLSQNLIKNAKNVRTFLDNDDENLENARQSYETLLKDSKDENGNWDFKDVNGILDTLSVLKTKMANRNNYVAITDQVHSDNDYYFPGYTDLITALGENPDAYAFKTGIPYVSHDGLLASLHQGEMVLDSSNASKLRELAASTGISGFLTGLLSSTKVSAAEERSESYSASISYAIKESVDNITVILTNILDAVVNLTPVSKTNPTYKSPYPQSEVNFSGGII